MKSRRTPSYLFLSRHGISYFRCRIPLKVKKQYNISKFEVRKSLHTSNYSEALRKARKLWVKMARYKYLDDAEAEIDKEDEMLQKGRELYYELQQIKNLPDFIPRDENDFMSTLKSQYEWDCLRMV